MTRLGMDVDVVEGLGRQLKGQAHQLQGVVTQIESLVNQSSTAWDGKDSQDFRQWWLGEHKPKLVSLQQMIDGLGTSALNNAQEQRGTSGGSVSGHSSGGTASPSTPGLATPSPGPGGNHAAPDAVPGAAPAGTGGAAIAAKDFAAKWAGKYLDYDHAYGNQCFDVFAQYNHDIVGGRDVHAATTGSQGPLQRLCHERCGCPLRPRPGVRTTSRRRRRRLGERHVWACRRRDRHHGLRVHGVGAEHRCAGLVRFGWCIAEGSDAPLR